jgi:undecaprenyl-diphosphatase
MGGVTLFQAIVLAAVQGLTEFLPISSTAHLVLVPWVFGWRDPGLTYDVVLHAGTLLAVLAYFARTWGALLRALLSRATNRLSNPSAALNDVQLNMNLLRVLVVATVPAAVAGYFLEGFAETTFRSPVLVAGTLIGVAVLMWAADRRVGLTRAMETVGLSDALIVGAAQAVSIIPGTSRSGITIAAALYQNLTREAAARFSFLLSAPIIAGATLKKGVDIWGNGWPTGLTGTDVAAGFVVSAIVGFAAIAFLVRYLQVRTLKIFIVYRVVLGAVILLIELLRSPV